MNRWNEGMYGERWKKFRRVLLLRYCKIYMNNKVYHPVFESNPTCGLHYALKLKNEGQFQKAEEILRKIKDQYKDRLFIEMNEQKGNAPVSYTHLTLPTILLV